MMHAPYLTAPHKDRHNGLAGDDWGNTVHRIMQRIGTVSYTTHIDTYNMIMYMTHRCGTNVFKHSSASKQGANDISKKTRRRRRSMHTRLTTRVGDSKLDGCHGCMITHEQLLL